VHTDSRFVRDERFSDRAPQLFERWIERDLARESGNMLVIDDGAAIAGYCSCFLTPGDTCGTISLVGVAPHCRRRGVARSLTLAAIRWLKEQGCEQISVVTQAANVRAQRLYQACGFQTVGCRIWFHRWRTPHVPSRYPALAAGTA
jgi:ribosomal protein S18 acetylase RimI-like enzyme